MLPLGKILFERCSYLLHDAGMPSAATWYDVARALRLTPRVARDGFSKDLTFPQLSSLVEHTYNAFAEPRDDYWLHGFLDGIEVFLIPFTSAASDTDWTIFVASCEAPVGTSDLPAPPESGGPLANLSRGELLALFMPGLEFGASICHPARSAARSRGSHVLVGATLSRALIARQDRVRDLDILRADLGNTVRLAHDISHIDTFVEREWREFSLRQGLFFDASTSRVEGEIHGAHVSIELLVEDSRPLRTKVRVEGPQRLLTGGATVEDAESMPLVRKVLAHPIDFGLPQLHARYMIHGDATGELRTLLMQPHWLTTLELPGLTRLWVKEQDLVWTLTGCPPRAGDLDVLAECLRRSLENHETGGPYR